METIRYILGKILRLVIILFILAFLLWMVDLLFPAIRIPSLLSSESWKGDWLPAPRNYGALSNRNPNGMNGTEYVPGEPYNGYQNARYESQSGVDFYVYTASGTVVVPAKEKRSPAWSSTGNGYVDRSLYVRNLSVQDRSLISYRQTIYGEARDTMFKNETFPVHIVDSNGRRIYSTHAVMTGTWSVPGWSRFEVVIPGRLPPNSECGLIFQSATQPMQVALGVRCN